MNIISLEFKLVPPQKKAKKFGKSKSEENINAEAYIIGSSDQPSRKKSKQQRS
jgi:ribosomal RNA assembly protein